jgi:flagellar biosynthesis protein FlhB
MADTPEKDDRTEEPTQRRLDQAIERGDVAKSQEISTFLVRSGMNSLVRPSPLVELTL